MSLTRREFLMGCSAAVAAMAGGKISRLVFAGPNTPTAATNEIFVLLFLRGGMDGLSFLAPYDDPTYVTTRGSLALPSSGANAAINLTTNNPTFTSNMGLHPKAAPLKELYDNRSLAIVHAAGLNDDTRSHFDAMDYIELGTPGQKSTSDGWLSRHLDLVGVGTGFLPVLASGSSAPRSLVGTNEALTISSARDFAISSGYRYTRTAPDPSDPKYAREKWAGYRNVHETLGQIYNASNRQIDLVGQRTLAAIEAFEDAQVGDYEPKAGVSYPNGSFGNTLKTVAQTIKLEMGLQVATIDLGGWDTHESQGNGGTGYFANKIDELARGLHAFYNDLSDYWGRLTILVQSEFGRRLGVNGSEGTDHGHGGVMLALGGNVNGGSVYGQWPGLLDLDQSQDLRITTDYRSVVGELLARRLGNVNLGQVFPGLASNEFTPLGIVNGTPPGPITFETGGATLNQGQNRIYLPMTIKC